MCASSVLTQLNKSDMVWNVQERLSGLYDGACSFSLFTLFSQWTPKLQINSITSENDNHLTWDSELLSRAQVLYSFLRLPIKLNQFESHTSTGLILVIVENWSTGENRLSEQNLSLRLGELTWSCPVPSLFEHCTGKALPCADAFHFISFAQRKSHKLIRLIPKWRPTNYSFVCILISSLSLVNMYKKQKNFEVKMRRRGLINMQTKE